MSAAQQNRNKQLHKLIDQLEDQLDRANCENEQLKGLLREAFSAGESRMLCSHKDFVQDRPTFEEWAKQKGLA